MAVSACFPSDAVHYIVKYYIIIIYLLRFIIIMLIFLLWTFEVRDGSVYYVISVCPCVSAVCRPLSSSHQSSDMTGIMLRNCEYVFAISMVMLELSHQ